MLISRQRAIQLFFVKSVYNSKKRSKKLKQKLIFYIKYKQRAVFEIPTILNLKFLIDAFLQSTCFEVRNISLTAKFGKSVQK